LKLGGSLADKRHCLIRFLYFLISSSFLDSLTGSFALVSFDSIFCFFFFDGLVSSSESLLNESELLLSSSLSSVFLALPSLLFSLSSPSSISTSLLRLPNFGLMSLLFTNFFFY